MADPSGVGASSSAGNASFVTPAMAAAPVAEFVAPPPVAAYTGALLAATVLGRNANGALLVSTLYGNLALQTNLALPAGSSLELRLLPGTPPAAVLLNIEGAPGAGASAPTAPPPMQLSIGTTVEAIVMRAPPPPTLAAPPAAGPATAPAASPAPVTSVAALPAGASPATPFPTPAPIAAPQILAAAPPDAGALPADLVTPPDAPIPIAPAPPAVPTTVAPSAAPGVTPAPAAPAPAAPATPGVLPAAATGVSPTPAQSIPAVSAQMVPGSSPATQATGPMPAPSASSATTPPASPSAPVALALAPTTTPALGQASPPPLPAGTQLVLRVIAPPSVASDSVMTGQVIAAPGGETMIATPIGILALAQRLGLEAGSTIAFERLAATPPVDPGTDSPPARGSAWPALDETLSILQSAAPSLAAQLRADLMPLSGDKLAGTLLFLMGALYSGAWPGEEVDRILDATGHDKLRAKLAADTEELRQLSADPATGDWRVLVLPLIDGASVQPVRLYTRRRSKGAPGAAGEDGTRFIVEVEMSRLGPLQLDGLSRPKRFDLMLRSQRALPADLRQEATALFHLSIANAGLAGEIAFSVTQRFTVAPMTPLRAHVAVSV